MQTTTNATSIDLALERALERAVRRLLEKADLLYQAAAQRGHVTLSDHAVRRLVNDHLEDSKVSATLNQP